jgi:hypothetical protein
MGGEGRVLAGRYRWRDIVRPAEELYRSWTAAA